VIKGQHMSVCVKWAYFLTSSRVAPQESFLSQQMICLWDGIFCFPVPEFADKEKSFMEKKIPYKIYLEESEMPKAWYNLRADMINKPAPLLNP